MSRAVVLAYLACALIWGTTWYAIRVCIGPGGYPTYVALALRFGIAAVVLLPIAARARPWPGGRAWIYLIISGLLDAGAYLLVYLGEERVSGGVGAVVYGTQPLILALLLSATRIEPLTRKHVLGAIISLAGVGVIFRDRLDVSASQAIGVLLVFGSVVIATAYSAIMKRQGGSIPQPRGPSERSVRGPARDSGRAPARGAGHAGEAGVRAIEERSDEGARRVPNVVATAIFLAVTALVLGVVAVVAHEPTPWPPAVEPTIALGYLGVIGSVVAFLVYFWLLDTTSLQFTSTLVFVYPLVALATDAMFEHAIELGPRAYAGAAITLSGLAVSLRRK